MAAAADAELSGGYQAHSFTDRRGTAQAYGAKGCGVELRGRKREAGAGGQAGLAVGPGPGPGREGPRDRRESRLRVGWTRRAEGTRRRGVRVWFGSGVGP